MTRAVVLNKVGAENLSVIDVPDGVAGQNQVLIDVDAASVNPVDRKAVQLGYGDRMPGRGPWFLGWDAAGTVISAGPGVETDIVGKRVLAFSQWFRGDPGLQRSRVAVSRDNVAVVQGVVPSDELTTFGLNGLTALQALDAAGLDAGQSVLIIGSGGGVGGLVAQLARHRGIEVHTAGREDHPADGGTLKLDALINTAPADPTHHLPAVRDGGVAISITTPATSERGIASLRVGVQADRGGLETVVRHVEEGTLTTSIATSIPVEQAADAYNSVNQPHGRIVLTF